MFVASSIGPGLLVSRADWRGLEKSQLDLSLMDFDQVDLRGSSLGQLVVRGSSFHACTFDGAIFRNAVITRWVGEMGIELSHPFENLPKLAEGGEWDPSEFELEDGDEETYGQLEVHRWTRAAGLTGCSLRGVDAPRLTLEEAFIDECDFSGANLTGASLAGSRLSRVNFCGAVLSGIDFSSVNLEDVNFSGAIGSP